MLKTLPEFIRPTINIQLQIENKAVLIEFELDKRKNITWIWWRSFKVLKLQFKQYKTDII